MIRQTRLLRMDRAYLEGEGDIVGRELVHMLTKAMHDLF